MKSDDPTSILHVVDPKTNHVIHRKNYYGIDIPRLSVDPTKNEFVVIYVEKSFKKKDMFKNSKCLIPYYEEQDVESEESSESSEESEEIQPEEVKVADNTSSSGKESKSS